MSDIEEFRDCKGYEGLYQVSNLGRVYSIKSKKYLKHNNNGNGYYLVSLITKEGKRKNEYIHRLVAIAFIDNPNNLTQVNHIDENKGNNKADNLEWCDCKYNNSYGTKIKRQVDTLLNNGQNCKQVYKCDFDGNKLELYRSFREAERENNLANGIIHAYFKFGYSQVGGYKWEIKEAC